MEIAFTLLTYEWDETFLLVLGQPFSASTELQVLALQLVELRRRLGRSLVLETAVKVMRPELPEPRIATVDLGRLQVVVVTSFAVAV